MKNVVLPHNDALIDSHFYKTKSKWGRLRRKINSKIVENTLNNSWRFKLYKSYWHYITHKNDTAVKSGEIQKQQYLAQAPNYGAGIGHQLANWNTGLYFADYFNLNYAYYPFSTKKWDSFFGFGEGEIHALSLYRNKAIRKVKLPWFNPDKPDEVKLIQDIISSYKEPNTLFELELDQGYTRQCDTTKLISDKFFKAKSRNNDQLIYNPDHFNIAVHIRRGDIVIEENTANANLEMRWLNNDYYVSILNQVLDTLKTDKKIDVYVFSQGEESDFPEFRQYENLHFCLDMGPVESVLHMIHADLLISSKSSFSYKPTLISRGTKVVPGNFWHSYPDDASYILADDNGDFDSNKLLNGLKLNLKT
ncbi:hypothetical protein HH214_00200 [Mucilaginibacter robiniae]|uniref:Glycosyl transferase family 11 n=1 Tax=Mucilaginibacter robiniae TaxID=2728022 RepID=A0A7L5E0Q4_9SPHI|nr:hypothetical protein [Mucilaginibacter robiniae]QJD94403.1 hypothetical protein HH214_00200 [Mucilaginibacter robiniae]